MELFRNLPPGDGEIAWGIRDDQGASRKFRDTCRFGREPLFKGKPVFRSRKIDKRSNINNLFI
jgi:hypothetical protein